MWNKNKICIICNKFNPNAMSKTCSFSCTWIRERRKQKEKELIQGFSSKKTIKQVSKTNWNTSAKFSRETKGKILIRDMRCIFCEKEITDIHHIFYWTECEYWEDRNNINKWVWVCRADHDECHSCKKWEGKRQWAINYIRNI
jgi:hypothetical protein